MSNMLNAVGVAPVPEMLRRRITVGLGNDGYIFDGFENMRATYLIHRVHTGNPNAIDANSILEMATIKLEMATIKGAELYGLHRELGSIEVGKMADLIVVRPDTLPTPLNSDSVVGHVINSVDGRDVRTTIVDGQVIMKDRAVLTVSEDDVEKMAQEAGAQLWERLRSAKPKVETP